MQEYKRKFKRAQQQVEELQDDRRLCEAKLSAVEISWNLVSTPERSKHNMLFDNTRSCS